MTVCKAGKATMHLDSHEKFTYLAPARGFLNLPEQIPRPPPRRGSGHKEPEWHTRIDQRPWCCFPLIAVSSGRAGCTKCSLEASLAQQLIKPRLPHTAACPQDGPLANSTG